MSDKPKGAPAEGPPPDAGVIDDTAAEQRSLMLLEQLYDDGDAPAASEEPTLSEMVDAERLAARCRESVDRTRRALSGDLAPPGRASGASGGIVLGAADGLDTARVLRMERAGLEACAAELGVAMTAALTDDQLRAAVLARRP